MGEHIAHTELSLFAHDKRSFERERREAIESHIATCAECGATFDFYAVAEEDLGDLAVWQPIIGSTAAAMRAYANQCAAEDREADELLKGIFAKPRKAALTNVRNQRKFHTGGVVRRLNAKAHEVVASLPLDALIFADLAQAVADLLPDDIYPNDAVYELRGTAWKERANALRRLAEFDEALESLRRSENAYSRLRSSGHGLAAVDLVRSAVYYERGELQKATKHVELAEHGYAHQGLERQRMKAILLRGEIAYESLDYAGAASTFQQIIDFGERISDARWIARGSYCRAACEVERGNLSEAVMLYHSALMILREIGPTEDRISTEWGLARVVLHEGKPTDAARRLRDVIAAFEEIGRVSDAALAGTDLAEALLVLERWDEIGKVAAHAFRVLKKAGILTGALMALAYLKEAAARRQLTPGTLKVIREYLRRVERKPDLLFAAPPEIPR
ncbi:MAG: MalT-like region [Acidobacteriota bacterium]|jgi:tetratricopeptide (TPR) repeat protein|nr:MalT-like region [Acidobacteriota bacterium]